jgi:hypothetical protein
MIQTVEDVHQVFELGSSLSQSGFAVVFPLTQRSDCIMRIQDHSNQQDILDEVRFMGMMSTASLAPKMLANYSDGRSHGMLSERYEQDLEGWFDKATPAAQSQSMWTLRVRRLLCGMAKLGIFCIDLKPANIVVKTEVGVLCDVKLIDFGGGLCWEEPEPWHITYVTMLLVFNASMKHSQPIIYTQSGPDGPFGFSLRRLLSSDDTRSDVVRILKRPLITKYWANLFFSVPMMQYFWHFTSMD